MFIFSTFLQPPSNCSPGQVAFDFEGDSKTEMLARQPGSAAGQSHLAT